MQPAPRSTCRILVCASFGGIAATASGQNFGVAFSTDASSSVVGAPDTLLGAPITQGDVLLAPAPGRVPAFGPLGTPSVLIKAGSPSFGAPHLGLFGAVNCVAHPTSTPCAVEVDALDLGFAQPLSAGQPLLDRLFFSVDRHAIGIGAPSMPGIASEAPVRDLASDVLVDLGIGALPAPPFSAAMIGSAAVIDGNGMPSGSGFTYRGLGLNEGLAVANQDELDALAFTPPLPALPPGYFPPGGVYFSLDANFVDPLTGIVNTGSAAYHGCVGGDVLRTPAPGAPPMLYASAITLGLDLVAGPDSDDLDALVLAENGAPGFQPSMGPFDWSSGATDMLLFSVRRGSAVVGKPDSMFGLPIEPGDVLTTPISGGLSSYPAIFIAAENLGLYTGTGSRGGGPSVFGDELDALELASAALNDCNGNGREDSVDIALGSSSDNNGNGIPDECERDYTQFCFCSNGPCGNSFVAAGCRNSTGLGALMTPSGTTSVFSDNLVLTTSGLPHFVNTINFMSSNLTAPTPFFDGRRCVAAPIARFSIKSSGPTGTLTNGPGFVSHAVAHFVPANWIHSGSTFAFQTWYRDPTGPCGNLSNLSSAVKATFTP